MQILHVFHYLKLLLREDQKLEVETYIRYGFNRLIVHRNTPKGSGGYG